MTYSVILLILITLVLYCRAMFKGDLTSAIMAFAIVVGTFICLYVDFDEPTAIDVYRGKTTLKITYKDGVAIDSVVVYKDKK